MIKLEYLAPYDTFGRPLTPEILEALGLVVGSPAPGREGRGDHPAPQEFDLWAVTSRRGVHYHQGWIELTEEPAGHGSAAEGHLRIRQLYAGEAPGEQREHCIEASVICGRDPLWSPRSWHYQSWMRDGAGKVRAETVFTEQAWLERRTLVRAHPGRRQVLSLPGAGRLAFHWGLWQAVRHLPRQPGFELTFDCLEHLRKLKRGHRLGYLRSRTVKLGGRSVRLHQFAQWGQGILPTEYWVDDADRLLLVLDGNRAAISRVLRPARPAVSATWQAPVTPKTVRAAATRLPRRAGRPNILFLCTDQQHWQALGAAGNPRVATPALDALCRRGTRFENAYCTNPICSPSRSSLFTGRMPSETGVNRLSPDARVRAGLPNLGEWLGAHAGYDCVYAGKWHVGPCHTYAVPGFRVLGCGQDHRGDVSDVTVGHACEAFLQQKRGPKPFCLVASLTQPHDVCDWLRLNLRHKSVPPIPVSRAELPPLPANFSALPTEPGYVRTYRRDRCEPNLGHWTNVEWRWYLWNYYRMVEMADAEIGRILDVLAGSPEAENTLVVFTSDHGEGLGEHRLDRKNFHYEAAIKVPLVFSWPGRVRENATDRTTLASGLDLMPTLCAFAGIAPPRLTTAQNLRPALEGRPNESRRYLGIEMSVRAVGRVLRSARFKYAAFEKEPVEQLFDLQRDPGETRNLAGQPRYRQILEEHRAALVEWERRLTPVRGAPGAVQFRKARRRRTPPLLPATLASP